MHSWCLLIKVNNFSFDEIAIYGQKLFFWMGGYVGGQVGGWIFRKYSHLTSQLNLGLGPGMSLAKVDKELSITRMCFSSCKTEKSWHMGRITLPRMLKKAFQHTDAKYQISTAIFDSFIIYLLLFFFW